MPALTIWLTVFFMIVAYGVVHDQLTIRLSPEYFLIGHVRVLQSTALTPVALFWGVASSVPGAILLAFLTTSAARFGRSRPPLDLRDLKRWIIGLPLSALVLAGAASVVGYALFAVQWIPFPSELSASVDAAAQGRFIAAWAAHLTTYAALTIGGIGMVISAWKQRGRSRHAEC